jgi:hypothetical protein
MPTPAWDTIRPRFHDAAGPELQAQEKVASIESNDTKWIGAQILPWVRRHPRSGENPALLEKVIHASHYVQHNTPTSKQAFMLLHRLYSKSPEAQRTKYYY